jgi:hypothetical protein
MSFRAWYNVYGGLILIIPVALFAVRGLIHSVKNSDRLGKTIKAEIG